VAAVPAPLPVPGLNPALLKTPFPFAAAPAPVPAANAQACLQLLAEAAGHAGAGRPADAIPLLERARAHDPTNPNPWQNHGVCLCQLGRFADALPLIEKACELAPAEPRCWQTRAAILAQLDRPIDEMAARARVVRLLPDQPGPLRALAWACHRAGRHQDALAHLDKYLGMAGLEPDALLEKLVILDASRQIQAAVELAAAIFNDPAQAAQLRRRPAVAYNYLIGPQMTPELKKFLAEALKG
jgi:Flp pilus assembly protein TadD